MFLHVEVRLSVDDFEQANFDCILDFWEQFLPEIGVGGGGKVREAESEL